MHVYCSHTWNVDSSLIIVVYLEGRKNLLEKGLSCCKILVWRSSRASDRLAS